MRGTSINRELVDNALYIDFEGVGRSPTVDMPDPHLLGVYRPKGSVGIRASYTAYLLRPDWEPIQKGHSKLTQLGDLAAVIGELVNEAQTERRALVHWSAYESAAVAHHCPKLRDKFDCVALNLKPLVDTMVNRLGLARQLAAGRSLAGYMQLLFPNSTEIASMAGGPADACRRLDRYCASGTRWGHWPEAHTSLAKNLIFYNRSDCRSTWRLATRLARHNASRAKIDADQDTRRTVLRSDHS